MRSYKPFTYGELSTRLKHLEESRTLRVKQEVSDMMLLTTPLENITKSVKDTFIRLFCNALNTEKNESVINITEDYNLERKVKTFDSSVVILSETEFKELSELLLRQKKELTESQRKFFY